MPAGFRAIAFVFGFLIAAGVTRCATARPVQNWTERDLTDRADLVVIATAKSSEDEPADRSNAKPDSWVGVNTRFEAAAVLKGKLKEGRFTVLHHRFFAGDKMTAAIINGPAFVKFDTTGRTEYLLFLKKLDDGRFEAVSGQYDPIFSVKVLKQYGE